jgi:putative hydrolase of the HAD superfamily
VIRAVLWDADGVLQVTPAGDWSAGRAVVQEFPGYLTGAVVDEEGIVAAAARLGLSDRLEEILRVWSAFEVLPETLAVVHEVRAAGTPCYLTTNQDSHRASRMRLLTPYADLLDGAYYSCDIGVAKPDTAYFLHVADDLGLPPADLLFLDDQPENVDGARHAGLNAELWQHTDGIAVLREHLATHGVSLR